MNEIKYRADIDGLRAIAVIPVVLFHLGFGSFSGGYVGVDVFFVISGFLISGIIFSEIEKGTFSYLNFYDRRIRRIFPALIAVLIATTILSWAYLFPADLKTFGGTLLAATLSFSNILFWKTNGQYFTEQTDLYPLLHTWSLSVEEQFYIFLPIALSFLLKYFRANYKIFLASFFILSFVLSLWGAYVKPNATFYLLPARAWELLLGAILAIRMVPSPQRHWHREFAAIAGLVFICLAIALYDDKTVFPGAAAMIPCLGTGLILWAGIEASSCQRTLVGRLLGLRVPVFIGLISYSMYLWHWPIIVFSKYVSVDSPGLNEQLLIFSLTVLLSYMSWRYIEQPFRKKDGLLSSLRSRYITAGSSVLLLTLAGVGLVASNGFPSRMPPVVNELNSFVYDKSPLTETCLFEGRKSIAFEDTCVFGGKADADIVIFSDSHGTSLADNIVEYAESRELSTRLIMAKSCPPSLGVSSARSPECGEFVETMVRGLERSAKATIVLSAFFFQWEPSTAKEIFWAGFEKTIMRLQNSGHRIVVIGPTPVHHDFIPKTLATWALTGRDPDLYSFPLDTARAEAVSNRLAALQARYHFELIPLIPTLCPNAVCKGILRGSPIFFDGHHLTVTSAKYVADELIIPIL